MFKPLNLVSITHALLRAAMVFCALAVAAMALALLSIPVIAANLDGAYFGIPADIEGIARADVLLFAAFALTSGLICFLLLLFMFRTTTSIIESAIREDPFVIENAIRVERIGWLLLAMQAAGLLTGLLYEFVPVKLREVYLDFGPSPVGLLAILMIFVLAQIFRRGSEMRAELEGTV